MITTYCGTDVTDIYGRWFSPGTPTSCTTKTGRHDIADILLKVALNTKNQINQNPFCCYVRAFKIGPEHLI
jgi:hypothetical protein